MYSASPSPAPSRRSPGSPSGPHPLPCHAGCCTTQPVGIEHNLVLLDMPPTLATSETLGRLSIRTSGTILQARAVATIHLAGPVTSAYS